MKTVDGLGLVAVIGMQWPDKAELCEKIASKGYALTPFNDLSELFSDQSEGRKFALIVHFMDEGLSWKSLSIFFKKIETKILLIAPPLQSVDMPDFDDELIQSGNISVAFAPITAAEFDWRIDELLRPALPSSTSGHRADEIALFDFQFNIQNLTITHKNKEARFRKNEFDLALFLFQNTNQLLSHSALWPILRKHPRSHNDRLLSNHIFRLRNKLELRGENGLILRSIRGRGYELRKISPPSRPLSL